MGLRTDLQHWALQAAVPAKTESYGRRSPVPYISSSHPPSPFLSFTHIL